MAEKQFKSLKEFYPYYLSEHSDFTCRVLHFLGTTGIFVLIAAAIITQTWWLLALIPVSGYGFAWAGHGLFEKNKPATFTYPLWSLASDFIMYWDIITGQLPPKMKAARAQFS